MALSDKQTVFGVHSVTAYNPDTGLPYGTAEILGNVSFNNEGEIISLLGGSSLYPWENEPGNITAEGSFVFRELPDWVYEAFQGKAATTNSAEAGGAVTTLTNLNGTSLVDATTGVASVGVKSGSEADVKTGIYVVKAVTATTVDVYGMTNVDFSVGTDKEFENDALKITASPLTISTGAAVEVPGFGVELTGGSGTIGMTADDTAIFDARAINDGSTLVTIGGSDATYVDVGLVFAAQKIGNNQNFIIDIMRAQAVSLPLNFQEKNFLESEIPFTAQRNTARNGVARIIRVGNTS